MMWRLVMSWVRCSYLGSGHQRILVLLYIGSGKGQNGDFGVR